MAGTKIRIKLRAYDHRMLDVAARDIVEHVQRTGAKVVGPVRGSLRGLAEGAARVGWPFSLRAPIFFSDRFCSRLRSSTDIRARLRRCAGQEGFEPPTVGFGDRCSTS